MELNKENIKKILGIITFSLVLYFLLLNLQTVKNGFWNFIHIISPFLYGAMIAFVWNLPMKFFERKLFKTKKLKNGKVKENKFKRPVSLLLSFVVIVLLFALIIKLVIPQLINVFIMCVSSIPNLVYDIKDFAINLTEQYPDISNQIQGVNIDWQSIVNDMVAFVTNLSKSLLTSSLGIIVSLIGGIFDTIVSIVFAVYILTSKEKLKSQGSRIIRAYFKSERAKHVLEICDLSNRTFANFLTGQCTEAIILGVLCFIGMILLRLPYAATISVFMAVTALVPIVGAFIGAIIGAILILATSPIKSAIFIIFIVILQQIETNAIYPKVVGTSVGLPGMWVLVAVVVGGSLGGILGLLIGLPLISVLYTIFKNDVNDRLKKKLEEVEE